MMGHKFWEGLAKNVGFGIGQIGAPMVKLASAASKADLVPVPDRIAMRDARVAGFFRLASNMGWGLYRVEDIDGGLGSIWSIEKAADGSQFLVKQTDPMGEVMRMKTAGASQRVAVAPPGEEKLVKKLKKEPGVDNPFAVAWSVHNKKKASASCGSCSHSHDGDVCDDCDCRIFVKKAGRGDINGPLNNPAICKELLRIREAMEFGDQDQGREDLFSLSQSTPGEAGRKISTVAAEMDKDTERGLDLMVGLFEEFGGNYEEWSNMLDKGYEAQDQGQINSSDVIIKEEGPHGR